MAKDITAFDTGVWKDPYFKTLKPFGKMIFIHAAFFDNDPQVIAEDLKLSVAVVQQQLDAPDFQKALVKYYG